MINQILIYTRPWEVRFGIMLAEEFEKHYPCIPIRFVTFFTHCRAIIQSDSHYEVIFLPELLKDVTGEELSGKEITEIDDVLYKKTGANINMMLNSERFLPKNGKSKETFGKKHLVVLNNLITKNTLSVSSMYDHFVYWLAGSLAIAKDGYHFAFCASGLPPNKTTIFKTPWETWKVKRSMDETNQILNDTVQRMGLPVEQRVGYMRKKEIPSVRRRFKQRCKEFKYSIADWKAGSYFVQKNPYFKIAERFINPIFKSKYEYKSYDAWSLCDLDLKNYKYIFCPLHFEPEAVINMFSPWLRDQIEMCRLISQALPTDTKLLVKDHPLMSGVRRKEYYNKIKEIPNVVLMPSRIQSTELLSTSIGVITLSGTATHEAAILGKPSICIARPPFRKNIQYADFSSEFKISDLHSIFLKWKEMEIFKLDLSNWNDWLNSQIDAFLVPSMNGVVYEINPLPKNVQQLVNFIKTCI